jgi:hypothetical protein
MIARLAALLLATATALPTLPHDARIAALVGAVSAERLRATDTTLVGFGTRNDFSDTSSTPTHGVFGARDWIVKQFETIAATSGGRMTVRTDDFVQPKMPYTPRAVKESSVIAELRGSEPGRIYVMSSHYDDCNGDCTDGAGIAPGADDNASGASAVLEAARVMAPQHFRGTIYFVCFDGEELGLWGSAHLAAELRAAGTPIDAVLNNDVIGSSHGGSGAHEPGIVRVFSQALPHDANVARTDAIGSENDSPSRELARFVGTAVGRYVPHFRVRQIFRSDRFLRGGDQQSFQDVGYPAVRITEANENFAHQHQNVRVENGLQYGDLAKYNDFAYLAQVTRANVASLAALALGPASPADVEMVLQHLGYTTTLRWKPAADAASYEVVWRASDAAQWQYVQSAGSRTSITLPVSKDDFVFGVRSVDAAGLRSPVAYPNPVRIGE